jgi:hypothetical protein
MFGFDYDLEPNAMNIFYNKFSVPGKYRPMETPGCEGPPNSDVIWPEEKQRKYLALYIRNSFARGDTRASDWIVTPENKRPGQQVPNFRSFLSTAEYFRLVTGSLKNLVGHVLSEESQVNNSPLQLNTVEYWTLVKPLWKLVNTLIDLTE